MTRVHLNVITCISREINGEENIIELTEEDCVTNFVPNAIPVQGKLTQPQSSNHSPFSDS